MKGQQRLTPDERDRAVDRLRQLTFGAALAGLVAVGGVGYVAAATIPGGGPTDPGGTAPGTTDTQSPARASADSHLRAPAQAPTSGGGGAGAVSTGAS